MLNSLLKIGKICMPVPSQGHCGFPSFPVVDWFCLFVDLWVLPLPLEDCSVFGILLLPLYSIKNSIYEYRNVIKYTEI
jgi:hypothetical protein